MEQHRLTNRRSSIACFTFQTPPPLISAFIYSVRARTMLSTPLKTLRLRAGVASTMMRGTGASQKRFLSIHEHLSMGMVSSGSQSAWMALTHDIVY